MTHDVHTGHCCLEHGCKYGDEGCTVACGTKEQESPCYTCYEVFRDLQETAEEVLRPFLKWLQEQGLEICEPGPIGANTGYKAEEGGSGFYPVRTGLFSRDIFSEYIESRRPAFPKEE